MKWRFMNKILSMKIQILYEFTNVVIKSTQEESVEWSQFLVKGGGARLSNN